MFLVFNKQKIYSYLVATSTVVVLFILSFFFVNTDSEVTEASSNVNTSKVNNIEQNRILEKENE